MPPFNRVSKATGGMTGGSQRMSSSSGPFPRNSNANDEDETTPPRMPSRSSMTGPRAPLGRAMQEALERRLRKNKVKKSQGSVISPDREYKG